ncbi:MAG: hypothetical protein IPN84_17700 [Sphingomonadales bacterium]|nr:hypothetical protein [Sphingomonadales bacterium]
MSKKTLAVEIACSQDEAKLFMDLVIYLWDRKNRPNPLPTPELDAAYNQKAAVTISQYCNHIDDFGIDCTYDAPAQILRLHDIEGAPDLSALAMVLIHLYPHRLPIALCAERQRGTHSQGLDRPDRSIDHHH